MNSGIQKLSLCSMCMDTEAWEMTLLSSLCVTFALTKNSYAHFLTVDTSNSSAFSASQIAKEFAIVAAHLLTFYAESEISKVGMQ